MYFLDISLSDSFIFGVASRKKTSLYIEFLCCKPLYGLSVVSHLVLYFIAQESGYQHITS